MEILTYNGKLFKFNNKLAKVNMRPEPEDTLHLLYSNTPEAYTTYGTTTTVPLYIGGHGPISLTRRYVIVKFAVKTLGSNSTSGVYHVKMTSVESQATVFDIASKSYDQAEGTPSYAGVIWNTTFTESQTPSTPYYTVAMDTFDGGNRYYIDGDWNEHRFYYKFIIDRDNLSGLAHICIDNNNPMGTAVINPALCTDRIDYLKFGGTGYTRMFWSDIYLYDTNSWAAAIQC